MAVVVDAGTRPYAHPADHLVAVVHCHCSARASVVEAFPGLHGNWRHHLAVEQEGAAKHLVIADRVPGDRMDGVEEGRLRRVVGRGREGPVADVGTQVRRTEPIGEHRVVSDRVVPIDSYRDRLFRPARHRRGRPSRIGRVDGSHASGAVRRTDDAREPAAIVDERHGRGADVRHRESRRAGRCRVRRSSVGSGIGRGTLVRNRRGATGDEDHRGGKQAKHDSS